MKKYLIRTNYRHIGSDKIEQTFYEAPNCAPLTFGVDITNESALKNYAKWWGYGNKGAATRALKAHHEMNEWECKTIRHWNPTSELIEFEF